MRPGSRRENPPARCALDQPALEQERFNHIFHRIARFRQRGGECFNTNRATAKMLRNQTKVAPVERVKTQRIDLQPLQCFVGNARINPARAFNCCDIAHPAQQATSNTGRATRAPRNFHCAIIRHFCVEFTCPAPNDRAQLCGGIKIKPHRNAEAIEQGFCQQAGTGGRADQGEPRQLDLDRARRWPLPDHDVEAIILHRRIEHLFHSRGQTMDLINEENIICFQIGQQRGKVAGLGNHRPGGGAKINPQLIGHNLRQRCFAKPGRAVKQDMVKRFFAGLRRLDKDPQIILRQPLANKVIKTFRTQRHISVFGLARAVNHAVVIVSGLGQNCLRSEYTHSLPQNTRGLYLA